MSLRYNLANRHSNSFLRLLVALALSTIHFLAGYCLPLLSAGTGTFRTSNLNTEQGLASSRAYSAIEGDDGAIWISTKQGVDRYNGLTVKSYQLPRQHQYSPDFITFLLR